ncbi:MAG: DUF6268 family outer membrane beta-barrel protein [Akkermansiaceae bacterium]
MQRSFLILLTISSVVLAGEPDAFRPIGQTQPASSSPWKFSFDLGYSQQSETDIDSGGEFSADHTSVSFGIAKAIEPGRLVGLSVGYGYSDYQFSGLASAPWGEVHSLSLSAPVRWTLSDRWGLFAMPFVRSQYESGASVNDGVTGGLLMAASYRVSDRLTIGPGIVVSSQLEDSLNVFPIIMFKWKITEGLVLQTGSGNAGVSGASLSLDWKANDQWSFSLGARYEKLRFRLDDNGPVPDGVGEEKGLPVYLAATYHFSKDNALTLYGGMKFAGSLVIENSSGNKLADSDYDRAAVFGLRWKLQF